MAIKHLVHGSYEGPILFSDALRIVERIGFDIASSAELHNWPHKRRDKAKLYQKWLPYIRKCFNDLRKAQSEQEALHTLAEAKRVINTGVETNGLDRAADVIRGKKFSDDTMRVWMAPKGPHNSRD